MVDTIQSNSFNASVNVAGQLGGPANISELIMAVQVQRADVLENQIKDQITDMQKRNEWLKTANDAMSALRAARPADDKGKVDYSDVMFKDSDGKEVNALDWCTQNGISIPVNKDQIAETSAAKAALDAKLATSPTDNSTGIDYPKMQDKDGKTIPVNQWAEKNGINGFDSNNKDNMGLHSELSSLQQKLGDKLDSISKMNGSQVDAVINNVKSSIDTVNSQSQMDMVRLQGLMDKRNQAFDMLTNSLSKFSKSMDGVIGNMR